MSRKKKFTSRKHVRSGNEESSEHIHAINGLLRAEALIVDQSNKRLVVVTKDILTNQLKRDTPLIAASFDDLCGTDIEELSEVLAQALSVVVAGMILSKDSGAKRKNACGQLLINASNSFTAATQLLRSGYVLQPGIVIRSILESISTVFHLIDRPEDFSKYVNGDLKSTKTIAAAKKAIPSFGLLYKNFSENFAHIGDFHREIQQVKKYETLNEALALNLSFLRLTVWLIYLTAELLFNELTSTPRYWHRKANGFMYNPSDEERNWMKKFLER